VRLIVFMMLAVAVLSALISVNGAVAALLPVVVVLAVRLGRSPGQLLMPLVFGAHCGSMLLLTGSPVNVLVSDALRFGRAQLRLFRVRAGRHAAVIGGVLIAVLLGEKLLPARTSKTLPSDLSRHAHTLVEQYRLTAEVQALRIREDSPLVGTTGARSTCRTARGSRSSRSRPGGRRPGRAGATTLQAGDIVVVRGEGGARSASWRRNSASARRGGRPPLATANTLFNRRFGLAEVVIKPRSPLIGERFFPGMVTPSGDLIVLAIQRQRRGPDRRASRSRRATRCCCRAPGRRWRRGWSRPRCWWSIRPNWCGGRRCRWGRARRPRWHPGGDGGAAGDRPGAGGGGGAAGRRRLPLTGILNVEQVYRSINWTTVILVGAMMPLSVAIQQTGRGAAAGRGLVAWSATPGRGCCSRGSSC
jgi:hypothetical protein